MDLKNDQASSEPFIIPLLPMALVAPDEVEKNSSPLYRYNTELAWGRRGGHLPGKGVRSKSAFANTAVRVTSWPAGRISG